MLKASNFTKSNTPPLVFFTLFRLYRWYQIAKNVTYHYHHYFIYYFFELPSLKMFLICFFSQFRCSYQVCSSKKNSVMLLICCLRDTDQTFESIPYISFQIGNICSNSATKVSVYRTLSNI